MRTDRENVPIWVTVRVVTSRRRQNEVMDRRGRNEKPARKMTTKNLSFFEEIMINEVVTHYSEIGRTEIGGNQEDQKM